MTARLASTLWFLLVFCCTSVAADRRTPILGPLDNNTPCDPPSAAMIRRALPGGSALRSFVLTSTRVRDVAEPPRFYPLVGWAQLRQVHWKCTVFVMEPALLPFCPIRLRAECVYVDQDRLHLVRKK